MENTVKLILFVSTFLLTAFSATAQTSIGVKAGIKGSIPLAEEEAYENGLTAVTGGTVGLIVEKNITSKIIFRTGLDYNLRGLAFDFTGETDLGGFGFIYEEKYNYLDIPLALKFKLGSKKVGFHVNTGASLGYALKGTRKGEFPFTSDGQEGISKTINLEEEGYNRFSTAFLLGGGLYANFGKAQFFVDATMDVGLNSIMKEEEINLMGIDFNIGLLFPLSK